MLSCYTRTLWKNGNTILSILKGHYEKIETQYSVFWKLQEQPGRSACILPMLSWLLMFFPLSSFLDTVFPISALRGCVFTLLCCLWNLLWWNQCDSFSRVTLCQSFSQSALRKVPPLGDLLFLYAHFFWGDLSWAITFQSFFKKCAFLIRQSRGHVVCKAVSQSIVHQEWLYI